MQKALAQIRLPIDVRVVLVGFRIGDGVENLIEVESGEAPLTAKDFSAVLERTEEMFRKDPRYDMILSEPWYDRLLRSRVMRRAKARAVAEAIEAVGVFEDYTFMASRGVPVGEYMVHTCIGVPKNEFYSVPPLKYRSGLKPVTLSLQHEVIAPMLESR